MIDEFESYNEIKDQGETFGCIGELKVDRMSLIFSLFTHHHTLHIASGESPHITYRQSPHITYHTSHIRLHITTALLMSFFLHILTVY